MALPRGTYSDEEPAGKPHTTGPRHPARANWADLVRRQPKIRYRTIRNAVLFDWTVGPTRTSVPSFPFVELDQNFSAAGSRHQEEIDSRSVRPRSRLRIHRRNPKSFLQYFRSPVHISAAELHLLHALSKLPQIPRNRPFAPRSPRGQNVQRNSIGKM